jgi:serine/threonine protein kinase
MDYLHKTLNIVHRDLKTANIFLVQTGDRIEIKIGDFGVSLNEVNLYEESSFNVGTLRYIVNIFFNYNVYQKIMFLLPRLLESKNIKKHLNAQFKNDQVYF